jgi:hypothetical protein
MDRIGLSRRECRLGIDAYYVVEQGQYLVGEARAGPAEFFGCIGKFVPAAAGATAMVAATLSMFTIPLLVRLAERGARVRHPDDPALLSLTPQQDGGPARVIIVGYGLSSIIPVKRGGAQDQGGWSTAQARE